MTGIRLAVAAVAPVSPDEAYYWVWSRALAPGYLDHPSMVALWIRAGTWIAGNDALGIRLLAPLSAGLGSVLLAGAAADLFPGRPAGLWAALLLNATLFLGAGAVTMTPDTPLLFFWVAALWALGRLVRTGNGHWWLVVGFAAGCALSSKYTAVLLFAGIGFWLLDVRASSAWVLRWPPWAGLALALLVFAPTIWWNAAHHWISFVKQGGRNGDFAPSFRYLGELIGGQVGLATPLVFLLCVAGTVRAWRCWIRFREPACALLAALSLPGLIFVEHAIGDRVQANWPAVLYPAAAIAAAGLLAARWQRWFGPAVALGGAMTAVVYLQAAASPLALPRRFDPTLAKLAGWDGLAATVAQTARRAGASYVAADDYGLASELALRLPRGIPVVGTEPRWRLFALPGGAPDGNGLIVRSDRRRVVIPDGAEAVAKAARERNGVLAETYTLYRVTGSMDGRVLPSR